MKTQDHFMYCWNDLCRRTFVCVCCRLCWRCKILTNEIMFAQRTQSAMRATTINWQTHSNVVGEKTLLNLSSRIWCVRFGRHLSWVRRFAGSWARFTVMSRLIIANFSRIIYHFVVCKYIHIGICRGNPVNIPRKTRKNMRRYECDDDDDVRCATMCRQNWYN